MEKKLRQVTDSIHGTIYLSDLESELISTPYFYRLHDIYQSSTVYMTFPSNRTKRYEHSLGTMALASRILFSSVTNAEIKTRDLLFSRLKDYFLEIVELVNNGGTCESLYFSKNKDIVEELFDTIGDTNDFKDFIKYIKESVKSGDFVDSALDYYQFYPMENIDPTKDDNAVNIFLYCKEEKKEYTEFLDALAMRESSDDYSAVNEYGFLGRYQMGDTALIEAGFMDYEYNWTPLANQHGVDSEESFLATPSAQDYAIAKSHSRLVEYIKYYELDSYIGTTYCDITITQSGLLAACHLVGPGNMLDTLYYGIPVADANGVEPAEYLELFSDYNVSFVW